MLFTRGKPRLELGVHRLWNYVELFWNSLDNAPSFIVFLEMKVEVGVHDIRSRFTPRLMHENSFRIRSRINKKTINNFLISS